MTRDWRTILIVCFLVGLIGLLSGCAMSQKETLANSSTDYNLVVEKVQNEMLLLNIVRASKRRPMYFTALSQVRGSMSYNFQTGSISIPFGKIGAGADTTYSVAPSVGYSTSPSFDLAVLDNEKFTRGIMTPVPLDTFYYYWQQGWPKEMLMLLFFERIEEKNDTEMIKEVFDNYPEDTKKFEDFQKKLRDLKECKFIEQKKDEAIGPKIKASDVANLQFLIEAQKAKLMLKPDGNEYQLASSTTNYFFECDGKIINDTIYRRSPEAILYYLGEIVRAQTCPNPKVVALKDCSKSNLFVVDKLTNTDGKDFSVVVDYEGTKYGIQKDGDSDISCPDRSMQVLSLISQLIGLHKSVEQMPVTGTVNVIGR